MRRQWRTRLSKIRGLIRVKPGAILPALVLLFWLISYAFGIYLDLSPIGWRWRISSESGRLAFDNFPQRDDDWKRFSAQQQSTLDQLSKTTDTSVQMKLLNHLEQVWASGMPRIEHSISYFYLQLFASITLIPWLFSAVRSSYRGNRGLCRACGYDLRATPGCCPECGSSANS